MISTKRVIYYLCGISVVLLIYIIYPRESSRQPNDISVLIVPGGGLLSDGSLPKHTMLRLQKAIEIYQHNKLLSIPSVIITLSAGTTHKPNPLDKDLYPLYESSVAMRYMIQHGVSPDVLFEEKMSLDTIGNVS